MSIDIDRFENEDPEALDDTTNAERVVAFLALNDDRAWKQSEIADLAGVKQGSIGTVLQRLHDRGLVRHKGVYWAITDDDERLKSAVDMHRITQRLDDRHGTENKSDWTGNSPDADASTKDNS